jgi:hypothetical protein
LTRQSLPHPAALQHVAICCNTLQYVATYCTTALQHAALRCSAGGAHACPEGLARVQGVHIQRGLVDSTRNDRRHVRLRKDPREARYECAPSLGADVWQGCAQSRCRCGRGEPSPGADVAATSPVPVQMCGSGEPKPRFKISRASLSHGALHKMGRPRWFRACPMSSCAWWPLATTGRPIGLYGSCGTSCIAYTLRVVRLRHGGGVRDERVCADTADFETVLPLVKPIAPPHLHRDWAHPCHLCARTGLTPCHICAGTGLTAATSAPGLVSCW